MQITVSLDDLKTRIQVIGKLHAVLCKRFKWKPSEISNLEGYVKGRFNSSEQREVSLLTCHPSEIGSAVGASENQVVKVSRSEVEECTKIVEKHLNQLIKTLKTKEHDMKTTKKKVTAVKTAGTKPTTQATKKPGISDKKPASGKNDNYLAAEKKVAATLSSAYPKKEADEKIGAYTQRLLKAGKLSDDQILLVLKKEFKDTQYTKKEISWNKWKLNQKPKATKK